MKKLLTLFVAITIVACTASKKTASTAPAPDFIQADVDRGAAKYPGLTMVELAEGKAICDANCGACHGLIPPSAKNEAAWNEIVPDMSKKVNKKAGNQVIDAKKQELLLKYLVTMSTK